jgi:hypothetical protein
VNFTFFAYYYGALAWQALGEKKRDEWARTMAEDLLQRKERDGTWLSFAVPFREGEESEIGGKTYSTAMALLALRRLGQ